MTREYVDVWKKLHDAAAAATDGTRFTIAGTGPGVLLVVEGTGTWEITPKISRERVDGDGGAGTDTAVEAINLANGDKTATITAAGIYYVETIGVDEFIADLTSWTSGTATVWCRPAPFQPTAIADVDIDEVTIGTVNQGTGGASAWLVDTELPAAAALADNMANPTAPAVAAHAMAWDGATWDRSPGDSANGLDVDVTRLPAVKGESTTSGGNSGARVGGLSNTATAVKSSAAGQLMGGYFYNPAAAVTYLQVFDVATPGAVTVGTTPPKFSFGVPPGSGAALPPNLVGADFANGIQVAATTTPAGATAPATALEPNFFFE